MHDIETNPCSEAKINMKLYFICEIWGNWDLEFAHMGSFKLLPPSEDSNGIINLFYTYN
jgi:hypothetical protein